VDEARDKVRRAVGCSNDSRVIFTSGATESNNLVFRGLAERSENRRRHVVVSSIEHKSVIEPVHWLAQHGYRTTFVPVNQAGLIDSDQVISALADDTLLVSVMAVNNEVGTIQPLEAIGKATRSRGILLHSDASQGVGKVPINMLDFGIDFLSLSAHKIYGPKGTGALCVATADAADAIAPQMLGGGQENGMRSGTLNVPGIVGLARAIELMQELAPDEHTTLRTLRDALSSGLQKSIDGVHVNGNLDYAVPGALNVSIDGVRSTALLARIPNIGLSGAAACGGKSATSHVLTAMGLNRDRIGSALRFGVGRFNTLQDIESVIQSIAAAVGWIRNQPQFGLEMSR